MVTRARIGRWTLTIPHRWWLAPVEHAADALALPGEVVADGGRSIETTSKTWARRRIGLTALALSPLRWAVTGAALVFLVLAALFTRLGSRIGADTQDLWP